MRSIFGTFVQAGGASKFAQGGLGIGLTLVKSLVERHGSTVEAISAGIDAGSTFRVRLSLSMSAQTASVGNPGFQLKLSLIGKMLLTTYGATVAVAYGGEEALHSMAVSFDAAVVDIGMPDFDGYGVAQAI